MSTQGPWTVALMLDGYGHVHRWAQAVSFERDVVAVSIFVLEGCRDYSIFDRGEYVSGMQFYPLERPVLHGDPVRAAALLGCDADVFRRYCDAIIAACDDPEEERAPYPRAYEDDRHAAADEYGFYDFARRIGVPGDPFSESDPVGIRAPGGRQRDMTGLARDALLSGGSPPAPRSGSDRRGRPSEVHRDDARVHAGLGTMPTPQHTSR